jgi:DNA-directed RNA polymerase specialized sigma24 family protein
MRRLRVESARRNRSLKRGAGAQPVELDEAMTFRAMPSEEMLTIDEALDLLAAEDPAAADLVKLKYFVGMKMEEAAAALGLSLRNAERLWAYSEAWLRRKLADDGK